MSKSYRYEEACKLWHHIVEDLSILAGDEMCPTDVTWQDVAGTLVTNLAVLAARINEARAGNVEGGPPVFPSPKDPESEHDH